MWRTMGPFVWARRVHLSSLCVCACIFWCTWHVWKLNKDLSLTVGHVHNHSEIISETGRWVDLPSPWTQRRQERQAIKPVKALNIIDIMKIMEISFYWVYNYYSSLVHPSYCTIFHSVTCGFTQIFILSSHHHSRLWIRETQDVQVWLYQNTEMSH